MNTAVLEAPLPARTDREEVALEAIINHPGAPLFPTLDEAGIHGLDEQLATLLKLILRGAVTVTHVEGRTL